MKGFMVVYYAQVRAMCPDTIQSLVLRLNRLSGHVMNYTFRCKVQTYWWAGAESDPRPGATRARQGVPTGTKRRPRRALHARP